MTAPTAERAFVVVIYGTRTREWGRYATEAEARHAVTALARIGMLARVITSEPVEFGDSRRKFLIAMFMLSAFRGDRVVERVAADIEAEAP